LKGEEPTHTVVDPRNSEEGLSNKLVRRKPRRPQPQRHQWFDAWKVAKGGGLKVLVENTLRSVQHHEGCTRARTRARKAVDDRHHRKRVEAVVCNLAHAVLLPPPSGRIAVQLGNRRKGRSRYDSLVYGKALSPLISMLWDMDFLHLNWSTLRGEVSSIAPSAWFARKVAENGVKLSDFGRDGTEEVVLLTRNVREAPLWSSRKTGERKLSREPIDYADTSRTRALRDAVRRLNTFLSAADIDFLDDGQEPRIDPFDRTLRRRFTILQGQDVRFDQGGRLFGGFWQTLRSHRRWHIRIDGEAVVALDYASMFTRLAYAMVGATPPEGDLYAIPGLEGYRNGVKKAMNCFLFDGGPRRSWPREFLGGGVDGDDGDYDDKGAGDGTGDDRRGASTPPLLPRGWGVARTKKAILQVHPLLKDVWGRQLGHSLMFKESEVLIAVLQQLVSLKVPALGLHDGLMVAASCKDVAQRAMEDAARDIVWVAIPVSVKGGLEGREGEDAVEVSPSPTLLHNARTAPSTPPGAQDDDG
jgi:hypothetical protein